MERDIVGAEELIEEVKEEIEEQIEEIADTTEEILEAEKEEEEKWSLIKSQLKELRGQLEGMESLQKKIWERIQAMKPGRQFRWSQP